MTSKLGHAFLAKSQWPYTRAPGNRSLNNPTSCFIATFCC